MCFEHSTLTQRHKCFSFKFIISCRNREPKHSNDLGRCDSMQRMSHIGISTMCIKNILWFGCEMTFLGLPVVFLMGFQDKNVI